MMWSLPALSRRRLAGLLVLAILGAAPAGHASAAPADLFAKSAQGAGETVDHAAWDGMLKSYVKPGSDGINRVDYAAFKADGHKELKAYIARLEVADPARLARPEQFALLANLYNAKTVDIVLDHYPVKSIKDISLGGSITAVFTGGPWKSKVTKLAGVELSLDDIEHGILRPLFKDPRVHYAVNCASIGCPNLATEAFTGAKLEQQLDAGARDYINHPRGVSYKGGSLTASSIFDWFSADFGETDAAVIAHFRKYAAPELNGSLAKAKSISDYVYDWSLNDVPR